MIKEKKISSMTDIMELISKQEYSDCIKRFRSPNLYRGLPNVEFKLATSLQRNCKDKQSCLEESILRNFAKYSVMENNKFSKTIWEKMAIGQHHGLPTRLMDWTYSPLIGLHFSTSGESLECMDQHDCVLWEIDIVEIHSLLPAKYKEILYNERAYLFTIDMLTKVATSLKQYDEDMNDKAMVLLEPPSIDQRIINQYSYFSIIPQKIHCIETFLNNNTANTVKYIIDKNLRWEIRDMLDRININERMIFPGLDGISAWLKRHYYVKNC